MFNNALKGKIGFLDKNVILGYSKKHFSKEFGQKCHLKIVRKLAIFQVG